MKNTQMGVVGYTLYELYNNYEDIDKNRDKIKKFVRRLSDCLKTNEVFPFNIKLYSEKEQSKFFVRWYQLCRENKKINRQILDNLIKMSWSVNWTDMIVYFLSAAGEGQEETIQRSIEKSENSMKEKKETLRKLIRCQDNELRGKKYFYCDLKSKRKELDKELFQVTEDTFLGNLLYFINSEKLISDFLMQILTYHISDNVNLNERQKIEKLQFIEKKLKSYYIKNIDFENTNNGILKDFSSILIYLNRRKKLLSYNNVTSHLLKQIQEGYSMEIDPQYKYSKTIIGLKTKVNYLKEYITKYETIEIPKDMPKNDFFKYLVNLTKERFEKENIKLGSFKLIIDAKEIQRLVLESEKSIKRFEEKLEESWDICIYLKEEWNRKIYPFYFQSIKNIYREMFLDKQSFCKRKAITIVRRMQEDSKIEKTMDSQEGMFILEKISRGFYRERGIGQLYAPETKVKKLYHKKILEIYSIKNIKTAIEEFKRLVCFMDNLLLHNMDKI